MRQGKGNAMLQFWPGEGLSNVKNNGARAFVGEGLWIKLAEMVNKPALAMEIDRQFVGIVPSAVDTDGAATAGFDCEKTELLPAQSLQKRANAFSAFRLLENELPQFQ